MAPAANSADVEKTSPGKTEIEKKRKKKEKPANEIEEIFRAAKGKKRRNELPPSSAAGGSNGEDKATMKKKSVKKNINRGGKNSAAKPKGEELSSLKRRKTADGLTIYSAEDLGFGNPDAGGTPLCPFDCSCCF